MTSSAVAVRQGVQQPRVSSVPARVRTQGADAVDLAALAGLQLDPWQQHVLVESMGEDVAGRWSAFEVGVIVARQNGKGSIIEARELAGLFLLPGERFIIHSAHEMKTAAEAFRRILTLIQSTAELDRLVKRVTRSNGEEGIELLDGSRLRFMARTGGSGRGFSGDLNILDEAYNLSDASVGALMPTMSARPNPQMWYLSSAVDEAVHLNGHVLARLRRRGMKGGDPSLAYFEWSAPDDADPLDPDAWALSNPGLGFRINEEHIAREQRSMAADTFAVERLSIGRWPSPEDGAQVIDSETWRACADASSRRVGPVAFAVDVTPDRRAASIGVAGRREDGLGHIEVAKAAKGMDWVVDAVVEMVQKHRPVAVVVDRAGPAGSLIAELQERGVEVTSTSAQEVAQACGGFYDDVMNGRTRHIGQAQLTSAVAGASKRPLGDAWAWQRKGSTDISPLVAVTLARYGHVKALGAKKGLTRVQGRVSTH